MNHDDRLQVNKILLIQLRQLGDILLTTPCVTAIRKHFPNATISFLSHTMGKKVLEGNPHLDELLTYQDGFKSLMSTVLLCRDLQRKNFDVVIDFMNNPRSAMMTFITQAKTRISFETSRSWAYTETVPFPLSEEYVVTRKFRLLRGFGISSQGESPRLFWDHSHLQPWSQISERLTPNNLRVAISPTHRRDIRRWPVAKFVALAEWLVREWHASIIWLWGPGEREIVDECYTRAQVPTVKSPPTSLKELAATVAYCDLVVANSNGTSHVAVAVDTPSLQIHGPGTDAKAWCPLSDRHRAVSVNRDHPDAVFGIETLPLSSVTKVLQEMKSVLRYNCSNL